MKYKLLLINSFLMFFSFSFMFSQEAYWTKINIPAASSVSNIALANGNIFLSNYKGLMKSSNSGTSWVRLGDTYYTKVIYAGNGIVIIQTMYNQCYLSRDYGNTLVWIDIGQISSPITSINKLTGNRFIFTTSVGVYYLNSDSVKITQTQLRDYNFINAFENTIGDIIAFTKDKIFVLKKDSESYSELSAPYFEAYSVTADQDVSNIFVISNRGLLKSTDFGNSWNEINPQFNKQYKSFYTKDKLIIADNNWRTDKAELLVSNDNGKTFEKKTVNSDYIFAAEMDSNNILLETEKGLILSNDFGDSWKNISSDVVNFNPNNIISDSGSNLRIITDKGINTSSDFGGTWNFKNNTKYSFTGDIIGCNVNNKNDYLVSTASELYLSNFNEDKWKQLFSTSTYIFSNWIEPIFQIDDYCHITYTLRYYVSYGPIGCYTESYSGYFLMRSTDKGESWLPNVQMNIEANTAKKFISSKSGKTIMLKYDGNLFYSNAQENKWNNFEYSPNLLNSISSIDINKDGYFFILDNAGQIYSSEDEGITWRKLPLEMPFGTYLNDLKISAKNEIFINLTKNIFYSADNGKTAKDISTGLTTDVQRLFLYGENGAYAVCKDGVYRLHNSISSNLPAKTSLQSPDNNSQIPSGVNGSLVTCKWDKTSNADYYEIIVGDSSFQKVTHFFTNTKDNFLTYSVTNRTNYWKVRGVNSYGKGEWSDVRCFRIGTLAEMDNSKSLPTETKLLQNYPNPFNPSTKISYTINSSSFVTLKIFDVLGREVKEVFNKYQEPGEYITQIDMKEYAGGIFYYRLKVNDLIFMRKMLYLK